MNSNNNSCNTVFPSDIVCLRNVSINTLHKGDYYCCCCCCDGGGGDDDDDDDNNNKGSMGMGEVVPL